MEKDKILNIQIFVQVEHVNRHLEESERALQEHIFKLEGQRIHLEEVEYPCSKDKNTINVTHTFSQQSNCY